MQRNLHIFLQIYNMYIYYTKYNIMTSEMDENRTKRVEVAVRLFFSPESKHLFSRLELTVKLSSNRKELLNPKFCEIDEIFLALLEFQMHT